MNSDEGAPNVAGNAMPSGTILVAAIDNVDECVAVLSGHELRYTYVNRAYQAIWPGCQMLGRRFREVFPEAAQAGSEARYLEVLATGQPWYIARYRSPVASDPDALWEGEAVKVAAPTEGAPESVVIFVRNVAPIVRMEQELARSEEALRHTNEALRRTIDRIADGLVVLDRNWRYTFVSERASRILGMRVEELVGNCIWELFPHAVNSRFHENYRHAMASGDPVHFEEYYPPPLDMWLECRCYPSADDLTVYFRDVTEQHRTGEELRKSSALLRAISDTSPDAIFAKDESGRMLFANPTMLALTGKPAEQVLGKTDAELLNDADAAQHLMKNDRRIMQSGFQEELEERVPMPDGRMRTWLSRKIPYRDTSGKVMGLLGIARDITERKQAEEELRLANRRKDEFLAMLAHELRNPLAPITTGAQLLELFADDAERVRQTSQIISRQAAHMVKLVDDLLDVSRVTRGLIVLQKETVDLKSLIAHAVEQARPQFEARRLAFGTRMAPVHVAVHADRTRIVQAISNLLNNAARYTPEGGSVTLTLDVDDTDALIHVSDTGVGIALELLPNIFDPFAQGERTPDRSQGGLGLGLTLVKSIAIMHGGNIDAHSDGVGCGSTFTLRLPLVAGSHGSAGLLTAPPQQEGSHSADVLIVDDNADAAESLAALLEAYGHRVRMTHRADHALELAAARAPDVFILDIGLPDTDGYQLARRLRADPAFAGATLIALTGYGQPDDRTLASEAGFDYHLVKPVNIEELTQALAGAAGPSRPR